MTATWQLQMAVRDYECDMQGVVNNAVYQNYLEHARHEFLKLHGLDFAVLAKAGINLVVVVNSNGALSQELPQLTINYGGKLRGNSDEMWKFSQEFNFAKVAQAMGCASIRVEKPGDIKDALKRALAMNRPVVVEVLTDVNVLAPTAWVPK